MLAGLTCTLNALYIFNILIKYLHLTGSSRVLRSQAKTANMSSTGNLVPQSTQQFMTPPSYHDGISSYLQEAAAVDPANNWESSNDHQNRTLPPVPTTSRSYHMMASSQRQYDDSY